MKRYIPVVLLFAFVISVSAIPISAFKGWDDLVEHSPEIFIARCVSTVDFISVTNKPSIIVDNMITSDVEVVSVLKGEHVLGVSVMGSQYWPYRGEYFLVFANYKKDEYNTGYTAIEGYRVIPLGHNFMTNQLAGKALDEQINVILARRLAELNGELNGDNEEKNRLEERLKKGVKELNVPTNAPPPSPKSLPRGVEF